MNLLEQIEGLVSGKIEIIKTLISLIKLETRLAGLSVYPLLLNLVTMLIVLMTLWFSSMVLLGYFLMMLFASFMTAILSVLLINLLLLILLNYLFAANLHKMSFEKTRNYFLGKEEHKDGSLKKANN